MSTASAIRQRSPALKHSVYPAVDTIVQPVAAQPRYAVYDKPADRRLRPWILLGSVLLGVCSFFLSLSPSSHSYKDNTHLISPLILRFSSTHCSPYHSVYGRCNDHPHFRWWRQNQLTLGSLCCRLPSWRCCNSWILHWFHSSPWSKGFGMSSPSSPLLAFPPSLLFPPLSNIKLTFHQFFWVLLGCWIASVAVMIVNGAMLNDYMDDRCNGKNAGLNCQDIREYHIIVYTAFGIPVALWVPTLIVGAYYLWRTSRLMRKGAAPTAPVAVVPVGPPTM